MVNAGGLVAQSGFPAPTFVTPAIVMTHEAVPAVIVPAETLIVEGEASETVAAQPVPDTVAEAPTVRRRPLGNVSINANPDCAGLPVALVRRKVSAVLPPNEIVDAAKLLVSVGAVVLMGPTVTRTVFDPTLCADAPTICVLVAVFEITVPGGGIAADAIAVLTSAAPNKASSRNLENSRKNARCLASDWCMEYIKRL